MKRGLKVEDIADIIENDIELDEKRIERPLGNVFNLLFDVSAR